ncbi:hypothetical protein SAMN04487939_107123 [Lysobacter sp. yr284]|uniref:hypothetical protein n=1 Tax=Lysobacter sp. yr284 TaxID=1761791 RepID=UPI00089C05F6|nr:hypothetical protein [Lysobacter sp. yr284]SDY87238.1 hypothetical protein SAMN04487939_107123 [Lysobacter sp. yr284]
MLRLPLAAALALLLSAPAFAQAPAAKSAAIPAPKLAPPALKPHVPQTPAPPGAQRPQDELYRQSPATVRLAEPGDPGFDLQSPQPLVRWGEGDAQRTRQDSENQRTRCAHSIKQMREAGADERGKREGRARRDCRGVSFGD